MKKILIYILLSFHVFFTGNIGLVLHNYFSIAGAASTAISYAGTAADLGDSTMIWTNVSGATGNTTGTSANSNLVDRRVDGNTLALTNFNLAAAGLPTGAIINGIQADVEWQGSNTRVRDTVIRLTKDGTTKIGDDKATNANGTATKTITTYGGPTDLWGTTWTAAEILSPNFGIHLQYLNRQNTDRTVDVFRVGITVDYTVPTNPILSVTKTDNDADNSVAANQVVGYTVTIDNSGTDATGISLTDIIDTDFGAPYNFNYANCGSPSSSFTDPTLSFSSIDVLGGSSCVISYDLQVDAGVSGGNTITNSADVSIAIEGGNDPAPATADTLTVLSCGVNDVNMEFVTDNWGYETFWSLTPTGNACGVGEIANGGNTAQVNCTSGGTQVATGGGYGNNATISEGPLSLTVGNTYDIHVIDDYGDGMTGTPDVTILQNGAISNTFEVDGNGGVFSFTVETPTGCADIISPNVTVNQSPSQIDPTTTNSAIFRAVFDEPINIGSFTTTDIILTGTTGTVSSGPTEIAPNDGTTFEFTVTGLTSGDTVSASIPAGVIEDIFTNLNNASTSIDNSITYTPAPGPGGISTGLNLWLKSNVGTSTIIDGANLGSWNDQSGNGKTATAVTAPIYRNNTTNNLNFYPVVNFNGTTQAMENTTGGISSKSYFAVLMPTNTLDGTSPGGVPFGIECTNATVNTGTCGLPFGGLVLGSFTAAIPDEVLTHALGSSANYRSAETGAQSYESGKPMLVMINEDASGTITNIYEKGERLDNFTFNAYQSVTNTNYSLGRSLDGANPFYYNGDIVEVINFEDRLIDSERIQIESYLALKYGITLKSGTQDYIASDGSTIIWDTNVAGTYTQDIFGIGRDNLQSLGQVQSKSINSEGIISIQAQGEGTNMSPSFVDINNNEFLTISNNGLANTWSPSDSPAGYYGLTRKWFTQETGEVGTINLDFNVANADFDIPAPSLGINYYFIYDNNNNGNLSDETPALMTNLGGDVWRAAGINLQNGQIFTIASQASTNNIPTNISLSPTSLNENSTAGSTVGSFTSSDLDVSDTHTYSLVSGAGDTDNAYFSISGSNISLNHSADYEIKNSYSVRIQTDDGNGGQYQKIFNITINNIGEASTSFIDFEDPLDAYKYTVTSGAWNRTTTNPFAGTHSMESNNGGINNSQSCFEIDHNSNSSGTIDFRYNVSSQAGSDFLRFYIDNVEQGGGWSGTIPWTQFTSVSQTAGSHNYKWCYIKDGGTNTGLDSAFIDDITFTSDALDTTAPSIDLVNFASGSLLPGGNHDIIINYSDGDSGIDTGTTIMQLYKWDGISTYGTNIAGTGITFNSASTNSASYSTNNLDFGKYQYRFSISDTAGNPVVYIHDFYIDQPEFIISTPEIDLGNIDSSATYFSSTVTITVRTVGAAFDVLLDRSSNFVQTSDNIPSFNGTFGYGYQETPYTNILSPIGASENIASQTASINSNGNKNTYNFDIQIGALIEMQQAAGDYEGNLDFGINLTY